ncbi:MAG: cytochrome C biogenesis protein [Nitrospirae bacterium CG2_30_53_67]|nr:MAG: cytochrome C biogenesis protein [Nitrospirae bacterium CG2_30_53_67]
MNGIFLGSASALWLGVLTSLSPCPLATNIAAVSYVGKQIGRPRRVLAAGVVYSLGRALTYMVLGLLLVSSLLSAPILSHWLQKYMNKLLGPILILVGMALLELIQLNVGGAGMALKMQKRIDTSGLWGAGLLGAVFALSFCPVSAALFFGSLIPLSIKYGSGMILPGLYGMGTGLPVLVFAILIAQGARSVSRIFDRITRIEVWARRITGVIFIGVGIYYSLSYIFVVL